MINVGSFYKQTLSNGEIYYHVLSFSNYKGYRYIQIWLTDRGTEVGVYTSHLNDYEKRLITKHDFMEVLWHSYEKLASLVY